MFPYKFALNMQLLKRGYVGQTYAWGGETRKFACSFLLVHVPPLDMPAMGHVTTGSPLCMTFPGKVKGHSVHVLFDTGASHSFISERVLRDKGIRYDKHARPITLADGTKGCTKGSVTVSVRLAPSVGTRHTFLICEHMLTGVDVILGQDWLLPRNADIFYSIR